MHDLRARPVFLRSAGRRLSPCCADAGFDAGGERGRSLQGRGGGRHVTGCGEWATGSRRSLRFSNLPSRAQTAAARAPGGAIGPIGGGTGAGAYVIGLLVLSRPVFQQALLSPRTITGRRKQTEMDRVSQLNTSEALLGWCRRLVVPVSFCVPLDLRACLRLRVCARIRFPLAWSCDSSHQSVGILSLRPPLGPALGRHMYIRTP